MSSVAEASRLAGFAARLPRLRTDLPTLVVLGAHAIAMTVRRTQLRTILAEAGKSAVALPPSLDGAAVAIRTRRAIRAQYGHCPAPVPNTPRIRSRDHHRPPPTMATVSCSQRARHWRGRAARPADGTVGGNRHRVVRNESRSSAEFPDHIRLELRAEPVTPRFIRSSQAVAVSGAPAILFSTGGRRGPTYALVWTKNGLVFALTGYGSSGDAVALANRTN